MVPEHVRSELERRGVPESSATAAATLLPTDVLGLILYGSYARGDYEPESDVDLLAVATTPGGTRRRNAVSVSVYTPEQLASAAGTLFGMHLRRDGVVIFDDNGRLEELLGAMGEPAPGLLFARIRHLAAVLDDRPNEHLVGRVRLARYLLRTAVYVAALAEGEPCFSVRELAARGGDPALVNVLASNADLAPAPSAASLDDLMDRLRAVLGNLACNEYGSLQNLVVSEWEENPERATLGALALAGDDPQFDYSALAKVLL